MKHEVLDPIGVRVLASSLGEVIADGPDQIVELLARHGVVIIPGCGVDDPSFLSFLEAFGELVFTAGETPVPGFPDLNVISNVGRTTPPRSTFHVDTTYVPSPPAYTALRAVEVPEAGGQTLFTNQYAAYETLAPDVREHLRGRLVTHVVTGLSPEYDESAQHPVFLTHPVSGRTALYLSARARCAEISGMTTEKTRETVDFLVDHSTREDNVLRHSWSPGDVVMWDNRVVMHRADHDGVVGDRVMHRGMVAGPVR